MTFVVACSGILIFPPFCMCLSPPSWVIRLLTRQSDSVWPFQCHLFTLGGTKPSCLWNWVQSSIFFVTQTSSSSVWHWTLLYLHFSKEPLSLDHRGNVTIHVISEEDRLTWKSQRGLAKLCSTAETKLGRDKRQAQGSRKVEVIHREKFQISKRLFVHRKIKDQVCRISWHVGIHRVGLSHSDCHWVHSGNAGEWFHRVGQWQQLVQEQENLFVWLHHH